MASFKENPEELSRLDYALLQNGSINLYFNPAALAEDSQWLLAHDYSVIEFDCSKWNSEADLHRTLLATLSFPDYYGGNLDALNDCLGDLEVSSQSGLALVFHRIDHFTAVQKPIVQAMFDILERNSRRHLLFGKRLITLAQSEDPSLQFEPVGSAAVLWNPREWLNKNRGL